MGIIEYKNKNILFCPLDWGLGHLMRLIPLIEYYEKSNRIFVYATDLQIYILKLELKDKVNKYNFIKSRKLSITYSRKGITLRNLFIIAFKIIKGYFLDKYIVNNIVSKYNIDVIISDNRYGCFTRKAYSIIITHQLNIQMPEKIEYFKPLIDKVNKILLKNFNECWVPDIEKFPNYAGVLSQNVLKLNSVKYIGVLSRLSKYSNIEVKEKIYEYAIIISAPYPQNEIIFNKIYSTFKNYNFEVVVVKGMFQLNKDITKIKNITIYNFVTSDELIKIFQKSRNIITTSGYTTLMDLSVINKTAFIIPTKGQTEQEYLAKYYVENRGFKLFNINIY